MRLANLKQLRDTYLACSKTLHEAPTRSSNTQKGPITSPRAMQITAVTHLENYILAIINCKKVAIDVEV